MSVAQKIRCTVTRIDDHGSHVYSLELKPERPAPQFQPGQFLHLAIDPYEPGDFWPESRVFSIASTPGRRDLLAVTYSVVGSFTTKMEQKLKVGSEVWVKFPYGDFVIKNSGDVVLIAGGTGVTAFTAFLEALKPKQEQQVMLFYGARSEDLLIFRPLVKRKLEETKSLTAWYFVEEGEAQPKENVLTGRLSVDQILEKAKILNTPVFYVSGPPAMLQTITENLKSQGISSDRIRMDAWE